MMIVSLLVVAAAVAWSSAIAAPIFGFYDVCEDCSGEMDAFTALVCDLMCETVEECGEEETTVKESTTGAVTSSIASASESTAGSSTTTAAAETTSSSEVTPTTSEATNEK